MFKLDKKEERLILFVIIILMSIAVIYKFVVFKPGSVEVIKKDEVKKEEELEKVSDKVYVYITGEVKKPGMYQFKSGDRISDAIEMAGGFAENADITSVNLAQKLTDEEYINIVKKYNEQDEEAHSTSRPAIVGGKININIATSKEIDDFLPGIGETLSNNIINYRNQNGRFKSVDEVSQVDGIGSGKRFEKIKNLISVN